MATVCIENLNKEARDFFKVKSLSSRIFFDIYFGYSKQSNALLNVNLFYLSGFTFFKGSI